MSKVALVTGADGFIGSHLVQFLAKDGWKVFGSYYRHDFSAPAGGDIEFLQCDISNGQRVEEIVQYAKPTTVFHLAAQSLPTVSWADPLLTMTSNVIGSLHLFEAVHRLPQVPTVVSACSSAQYGFVDAKDIPVKEEHPLVPLHPYGVSKAAMDQLSNQYFVNRKSPFIRVRLFNTTGAGKKGDAPSDFVRQLARIHRKEQEPVIRVGNLEPHRAFLDVEDTVRGFFLAATKGTPGAAYNLCAYKTQSMQQLLDQAIQISGTQPEVRPEPTLMRPSDERIIFGDTTKIQSETGWRQTVPLETTLQRMFDYWIVQPVI